MKRSLKFLSPGFALFALVACSQIDDADNADREGLVHDVLFTPDGADELLLVGTYDSFEKTVMTSFASEELYGLSVTTGQESMFLSNASDGPTLELGELPIGEPLEALGYVDGNAPLAKVIPGTLEVHPYETGDAEPLSAAGGCTTNTRCTSYRPGGNKDCSRWNKQEPGHISHTRTCYCSYAAPFRQQTCLRRF